MSFLTLRLLLFVAECLLASLLLPLLAFAATRFLRRAALRHLAWVTMFGVLALLPLAALLLPARQIVLPVAVPPAATMPAPELKEVVALPPMERVEALPEMWEGKRIPAPALDMPALDIALNMNAPPAQGPAMDAPALKPLLTPENGLLLLVLLWVVGLAWHLGRMGLGMAGLSRLRRESELLESRKSFEIRLSRDVAGPATFGIVRPLVLLPEAARRWRPARLEAVLAHEGAHVRRHDIAAQSLARLVCAFFWFNPLLWLAARALRREAELAADDAVLAGGMTPSAYAAELVALAGEILKPVPALRGLGAGMADSPLMTRVQSVLATNISRKGATAMDIARMLSLGLAAMLLLGTARIDLALAQGRPANPAPAAHPAPAAPAGRAASPQVDIEVRREITPRMEVEEEIKARAAAMQADRARMAAAAEEMKARAQQMAAESAEMKARAEQMATASADMATGSGEMTADRSQRMAAAAAQARQAEQRAREAQQRAREAEQRALDARTRAEESLRRMEREKQIQGSATPTGTLPLARLLLPLPPGAAKDAIDNTMKVSMQIRQATDSCATLEKISRDPVLQGSAFANMGNYTLADLHPEVQKALAQAKSGEVAAPVMIDEGVFIFARCD